MKAQPNKLTDERIEQALNLLKDCDSVELKLTVPDTDQRSTISALDMDVLDAELRQVVFFDTPDLKLSGSGVLVRARRVRKGGDTVVKLRPVVPAEIPDKLRHSKSFRIEVDAMPGTIVCSGSLKGKVDNTEVNEVLRGERPVRKLFQQEQRSFYKEHAPKGLDLDALEPFGPITVAKLNWSPPGLRGRLAAEVWFYPDGSRVLELSTKCAPDQAFQVLAETRIFLKQHGVTVTGEQQTKTRKALEYFSRLHGGKPSYLWRAS